MTAETTGSDDLPSSERPAETAAWIDSGELRAVILTAAAFAIFLYITRLILLPFILAGVVAYVCTPFLDWAAARTRWPRPLFAVATFIVLVGVSALVMKVAVQRLAVEAKGVAIDLQAMLDNLTHQLMGEESLRVFGRTLSPHDISQAALEHISDWFAQPDAVTIVLGVSLAAIMGTFLTIVLLFWFLVSGPRIAAGLFWIVPPHRRPLAARVWARLDPVLIRYFIGVFVIVIYATIAAYIGLGVFLDIRHAVLLATLTGILEIVPVIGPTSAAVIAGLISLRTATGIMSIFAYAMYATALRLSIDQVVGPIVLGRAAHVHPALIIFCFLAGGVLLGVPGVILAVPLALLIKSALATLYGDADD